MLFSFERIFIVVNPYAVSKTSNVKTLIWVIIILNNDYRHIKIWQIRKFWKFFWSVYHFQIQVFGVYGNPCRICLTA